MYGCGAVQAGRTLSVDVEQQRERESGRMGGGGRKELGDGNASAWAL
jgi:hypothetical protein